MLRHFFYRLSYGFSRRLHWMAVPVLVIGSILFNPMHSALGQEETVSAITAPIRNVTVSASASGRIAAIHLREGDRVRKGQLILTLDMKKQKLEVERRKLIWDSKVEVQSAASKVAALKAQLASSQRLFERTKSVSGEELQRRQLEYELALAEHRRLEITEERQRLEYEFAREDLQQRHVTAPIGGIINKLFLEEGESCQAHQPLLQIVDTEKGLFVCTMEEPVGRRLHIGDEVDLAIRMGTGVVEKKGRIVFASPVVDPASSLMEVKAEFENRDGVIRPGVPGSMRIDTVRSASSKKENRTDNTLAEDIARFVQAWAEAWSHQDADSYLACYAKTFETDDGIVLEQWRDHRKKMIESPSFVSVVTEQLKVTSTDGDNVEAAFIQTYRSDSYSDQVFKTLRLIRTEAGWKIHREDSSPIETGTDRS